MFVWAMLTTGFLLVLAAPVLVGGMYMIITDRTAQTAFFTEPAGRQPLPVRGPVLVLRPSRGLHPGAAGGFGIMCELLPVFSRNPLFG